MNKRWLFGLLAVIIFAGGAWWLFGDPADSIITPPVTPQVVFEGTELIEEANGKRLWHLKAATISIDPLSRQAQLTTLQGSLYRDDGSELTVTAKTGTADTIKKELFLSGEVIITATADNTQFTAPQVRYSEDGRLTADGGVRLTQRGLVLTADNLEADLTLEQIKLQGNAKIIKGGSL